MTPHRVLICGSRDWGDVEAIRRLVARIPMGSVVIEGEARGADRMAKIAAMERGLTVQSFYANWDRHGRAAGPIRNQRMLDEGKPTLVVYFSENLAESKGTKDMVRRATDAGIPVVNGREAMR